MLPYAIATLIVLAAAPLYAYRVRPWHLRWGATDEEFRAALPGDDLVPHPVHHDTHAITIHAPAGAVWPWLAQMGQGRGGFYTYTFLENLFGCDVHNAERIMPGFQELHPGDAIYLHPKAPAMRVVAVEPRRALVLGCSLDPCTWGFFLREVDERTSRLVVRSRWGRRLGPLHWLIQYLLLEPIDFVMERKSLLGIRDRAQAQAAHASEPRAA
jgi:hypothetical protein